MGHIVLQMMISVDGMVSGPQGELDWIANDESLNRANLEILRKADVAVLGAGSYPEMSSYWTAAESDESADAILRDIGRAMNEIRKVVYSHHDMPASWRNTEIHIVGDDSALVKDVQRLKQDTGGIIMVYGGVRLARTFVQHDLPDEIHLSICPIVLGVGQPLFTELTNRTNLRLRKTVPYDSGATEMHYEVTRS